MRLSKKKKKGEDMQKSFQANKIYMKKPSKVKNNFIL